MAEIPVQLVPFIPPPQISLTPDEEHGYVLFSISAPYNETTIPIPPNNAINLSRALFKLAKELNLKAPKAVKTVDPVTGLPLLSKAPAEPAPEPEDAELESE